MDWRPRNITELSEGTFTDVISQTCIFIKFDSQVSLFGYAFKNEVYANLVTTWHNMKGVRQTFILFNQKIYLTACNSHLFIRLIKCLKRNGEVFKPKIPCSYKKNAIIQCSIYQVY